MKWSSTQLRELARWNNPRARAGIVRRLEAWGFTRGAVYAAAAREGYGTRYAEGARRGPWTDPELFMLALGYLPPGRTWRQAARSGAPDSCGEPLTGPPDRIEIECLAGGVVPPRRTLKWCARWAHRREA